MKYANIKYNDIANGLGIRTSLFVSGCEHCCKECFNKEAWDFDFGKEFSDEIIEEILSSMEEEYISGLSLLGGEPLHPRNQEAVLNLIRKFRKKFGIKKNIWCYTGYTYNIDFLESGIAYTKYIDEILESIDILVDGKFIKEFYDISLKFRGSSNQKIIDLKTGKELKL